MLGMQACCLFLLMVAVGATYPPLASQGPAPAPVPPPIIPAPAPPPPPQSQSHYRPPVSVPVIDIYESQSPQPVQPQAQQYPPKQTQRYPPQQNQQQPNTQSSPPIPPQHYPVVPQQSQPPPPPQQRGYSPNQPQQQQPQQQRGYSPNQPQQQQPQQQRGYSPNQPQQQQPQQRVHSQRHPSQQQGQQQQQQPDPNLNEILYILPIIHNIEQFTDGISGYGPGAGNGNGGSNDRSQAGGQQVSRYGGPAPPQPQQPQSYGPGNQNFNMMPPGSRYPAPSGPGMMVPMGYAHIAAPMMTQSMPRGSFYGNQNQNNQYGSGTGQSAGYGGSAPPPQQGMKYAPVQQPQQPAQGMIYGSIPQAPARTAYGPAVPPPMQQSQNTGYGGQQAPQSQRSYGDNGRNSFNRYMTSLGQSSGFRYGQNGGQTGSNGSQNSGYGQGSQNRNPGSSYGQAGSNGQMVSGSHMPPTGSHMPPTGSHMPPTGSHMPPTGSHMPPTGSNMPPTGSYSQSGSGSRSATISVSLKPVLAQEGQYPSISYTLLNSRSKTQQNGGSSSGSTSEYSASVSQGYDRDMKDGYGQNSGPSVLELCEQGFNLDGFCKAKYSGLYSHPNPQCFIQCDQFESHTSSLCAPGTAWMNSGYEPSSVNQCVHSINSLTGLH